MKIIEKKEYLEILMEKQSDVIKIVTSKNNCIYLEFKDGDLLVTRVKNCFKSK